MKSGFAGTTYERSSGPSSCKLLIRTHTRAPAVRQRMQHAGSQGACFSSPRRRREVLEILDQHVGAARRHRVVRGVVGAGAEQPGPKDDQSTMKSFAPTAVCERCGFGIVRNLVAHARLRA